MTKEKIEEVKAEIKEEIVKNDTLEIGNYKEHVEVIRKGLSEFKIWNSLTYAFLQTSYPNENNRLDLTDKKTLDRISEDLKTPYDYEVILSEIKINPWLIVPNSKLKESKKPEESEEIDNYGKKITQKQIKINEKKKKLKAKIDLLNNKLAKIKDKTCERANKLKTQIEELEKKSDRLI